MHILHVIDSLAVGGAERMLVDIANATVKNGYQVSVCITRSRSDLAIDLDPQIERIVLGRVRRFDFVAARRFSNYTKKNDVKIIHVHGRSTLSFVFFMTILFRNKIPIVFHDHYGGIEIDQRIPIWFRILARAIISAYIGVYQKLGDWAVTAGIDPKRVYTIGNGIDMQRVAENPAVNLKEQFGIEDSARVGVMVAGLRREKGIDLLIRSLAECTCSDFKILVVGGKREPVYVEECKTAAERIGMAHHLIFAGERQDVPGIIKSVDFGLVPSRSESGPLVLIEYMAADLPFVSFEVGDIAQNAAQYGVQGFVEPGDTTAFATSLQELLSLSDDERYQRGVFGRRVAEEHFSIQAKMPQLYSVYDQVLQNP